MSLVVLNAGGWREVVEARSSVRLRGRGTRACVSRIEQNAEVRGAGGVAFRVVGQRSKCASGKACAV